MLVDISGFLNVNILHPIINVTVIIPLLISSDIDLLGISEKDTAVLCWL